MNRIKRNVVVAVMMAMAMSMSHSGMMCCVNSFAAKLALTAGRDLK